MQTDIQAARDNEGYIVNPDDWNENLARKLAAEEQLELTDEYWPILCFMRNYWQEHTVAPDVRHVIKHLVEIHGFDKKAAKQHLFQLFPYGYVKQSCKIAGMQRPRGWSTG
ncbi:MAG: TusE/DsrC/DsvC family sulfur relay protein [Gammaproteobacteria bacterium]|nr:TusE/DsrC/DsvC family sulfur relay protein [Gammaproteobacteria bacterium]